MSEEIYYTALDGTVIDDNYIQKTLDEFDAQVENDLKTKVGKCDCCSKKGHHISFKDLPEELQDELKPFILNA